MEGLVFFAIVIVVLLVLIFALDLLIVRLENMASARRAQKEAKMTLDALEAGSYARVASSSPQVSPGDDAQRGSTVTSEAGCASSGQAGPNLVESSPILPPPRAASDGGSPASSRLSRFSSEVSDRMAEEEEEAFLDPRSPSMGFSERPDVRDEIPGLPASKDALSSSPAVVPVSMIEPSPTPTARPPAAARVY